MQKKILVGIVCALAVAGLVGVSLTKATGLFSGVDSTTPMVYVGPFAGTVSVGTSGVALSDSGDTGTFLDVITITGSTTEIADGDYGISGELTVPLSATTTATAKVSGLMTVASTGTDEDPSTVTITGTFDPETTLTADPLIVLSPSQSIVFEEGTENVNLAVATIGGSNVTGKAITGTLKLTGADAISAAQDAIEASPATYNTIAVPAATYVADTTGTTVGVYRAEDRTFYLRNSNDSGVAHVAVTYGNSGDVPLVYNNGITVYRPSETKFYIDSNNDGLANTVYNAASYAKAGDVPIASNAASVTTLVGVYRPSNSTFYLDKNQDGDVATGETILFGDPGDLPIAVGNGIAVYRPSNKTFYVDSNLDGVTNATYTLAFAQAGDVPFSDGTNVGLYRPSTATFTLRVIASVTDVSFVYGNPGDTPLFGDWGVGFWLSLEDYYE